MMGIAKFFFNQFDIRYLILLSLVVLVGCSTSKNIHNATEEYLDIDFIDNQHFTYNYYKYDLEDLVVKYCEGIYYLLDSNKIVLTPNTFDNKNYDIHVLETIDKKIEGGTRIRIELGLDFEKEDFGINLILNDTVFCFFGTSVDTIINQEVIDRFRIEIFLSDDLRDGKPVPTYDRFITKEYTRNSHGSNLLYIKIPLVREEFYYLNENKILLLDKVDRYILLKSGREFLKRRKV